MSTTDPIIVAVTGASGSIYAKRLIEVLRAGGTHVNLIISDAAKQVIVHELGADALKEHFSNGEKLSVYDNGDIGARMASGTSAEKKMVVIPTSMGTIARIAAGISSCLIERAADVVIKERGHLVLVPRETPFSSIHLENMLKLSHAGVTILPAAPAFYQKPQTIDDLAYFIVTKTLDLLGIKSDLIKRWQP